MAETESYESAMLPEDLEDGEIEDDFEEDTQSKEIQNENQQHNSPKKEEQPKLDDIKLEDDVYYSRSGKKKKSKNKDQKSKDKSKKYLKRPNTPEDDFAGSIEKALRKVLNKDEKEDLHEDGEERRKRKKRKKNNGKEGISKKKKKHEYVDEVDENEMMCVRGASPVQNQPLSPAPPSYDEDSYASDSSADSRDLHSRQRHRSHRKNKSDRDRDRRRGNHLMQDADGICLYFMQGKCHKGDDCIYSHDAQPPRKMELCKFYLMDCCAKRDKCLYMHSDFPCKYYHTGLPCINKDDCKFAHGKPLTEALKIILLKHIESAPKEILGEFPRLSKDGAAAMISNTQNKLMQQFNTEVKEPQEKAIPSLFEINIPKPPNLMDSTILSINSDKPHKASGKIRQSRWQNEDNTMHSSNSNGAPGHVLSLKNLNGVLTPKQITDLTKMNIQNLEQLGQLTVLQLNSIGISLKQITEIQLNTMNIQKLGLISTNTESLLTPPVFVTSIAGSKDLDLRLPPAVPTTTTVITESSGKDIDMRFQPPIKNNKQDTNTLQLLQTQTNKDVVIDIDQYTKDALKFATKDNKNVEISSENVDIVKKNKNDVQKTVDSQTKDVDQRVLQFADDTSNIYNIDTNKKETDTDIRFLQPGPIFKNTNKTYRPSTTDDEDNNLLIDEKWYSSDEDKPLKPKSNSSSPVPSSPKTSSQTQIKPETVLSKLGDLSQFAISDEVTKLLNTMKSNLQDTNAIEKSAEVVKSSSTRDPRNTIKKSPDHKNNDANKISNKKPARVSIYECVEGEPTDGRRRSDVDLRQNDFKMPAFGDTDLRPNSSGDVDFRLSLPFKPIPNYTPASEIDGSINSHPPITYKVVTIDIPRPDYTDIRNSTAKSQALVDPRLRKVFRLSIEESNSDSEKPTTKQVSAPRVDPRRKQKEEQESKPSLELQTILQNSDWFKELSTTQKIYVNQNLALVTSMIKQHQQDKSTNKKFDATPVQSNPNLVNIFNNLGVSLNENAEFIYLPKQKEGLLKTPIIHNQNYGMGNTNMDNMNVMKIPHMNMSGVGMNMGPMSFNHPIMDPRGGPPTPGLLGIAPNIPHNFDNNFNGPNFPGMHFNGNDFGNMDQNFQRFPNRGGFRGRGNDRWNRGGGPRGHRDRKGGYDRGGWKGDRK